MKLEGTSCDGSVTIQTTAGTLTGTLRLASLRELASGIGVWRERQGELVALVAHLISLGVLESESIRFLAIEDAAGHLTPLALGVHTPINRQPLLAVLRQRQLPECTASCRALVEPPPHAPA